MEDSVIDSYVKNLLTVEIEEKNFELYIDIFSRFLGYSNPNYKYNGTYLSQYINEFKIIYHELREKKKVYDIIINKLNGIRLPFELILDDMYSFDTDNKKLKFTNFEINKITSKSINAKVTIKYGENKYLFCNDYKNENEQIADEIVTDVTAFIKRKKIGG